MTALRRCSSLVMAACRASSESATVFVRDVGHGLLEVCHNTLALVGLLLVAGTFFVAGRPDIRHAAEVEVLGWLQARHDAKADPVEAMIAALRDPDAVARATATDPRELTRQQAAVAQWLSRRYHVAPEPISRLVQEAWVVGQRVGLEPTLILAIMAVESSFNPFAQSPVGAQGLMQVMTKVHDDKYVAFGGNHAAFDPVTNLRVGVQVLKECIARAGGLEAGLRFYVGAGNMADDGGYAGKVLSEQSHLMQVAAGKNVPPTIATVAVSVPAAPAADAASRPAVAQPATVPVKTEDAKAPEQVASAR
jgi:Transglycosylase SLT domain